jgi:hypothetical protein
MAAARNQEAPPRSAAHKLATACNDNLATGRSHHPRQATSAGRAMSSRTDQVLH